MTVNTAVKIEQNLSSVQTYGARRQEEEFMFDQYGRVLCDACGNVMLLCAVQPTVTVFQCTDGACLKTRTFSRRGWKLKQEESRITL